MTEQRLDDCEIHPGLGQGGTEAVPQRVRVRAGHLGADPVVAEDRAQPGRGEPLPAVGSLGDHEQRTGLGVGSFSEQVRLNPADHLAVDRYPSFPPALAKHSRPTGADVHLGDIEGEDLGAAQAGEQHQPGDRLVSPGPQARQERVDLGVLQTPRQPLRLPGPQR